MSIVLNKKVTISNVVRHTLLVTLCITTVAGCVTIVSKAGEKAGSNLAGAILNSNDLETIKAGTPAYLILLDSLIQAEPNSSALLSSAAQIVNAYAGAFVEEPERAKILSEKSLDYAARAACLHNKELCSSRAKNFEAFKASLSSLDSKDVSAIYTLGSSWASWIQANSDDWNSIAQMARVQLIMETVVKLDEQHDKGGAHLYLGTLASLLPPALGGKPEVGKRHFIRAIELSENKNLLVKTLYAELYARLVFDQELHDRLLNEVLASDATTPDLTLINTFAQKKAKKLLAESNEYF
ncbi:MAG: TRAP transporter TatT component family protein [Gammaproteobacteria bacterium]|nr:TRAP transporter TatT component family protein [Gammaproteobacteria bacterium]